MGFPPREVDQMSLWEFMACWNGYVRANSPDPEVKPPTYEEHLALVAARPTLH